MQNSSSKIKSSTQFAEPLRAALDEAFHYLETVDERSVAGLATAQQLRAQLGRELPTHGTDPGAIVRELARDVEGGLHASAGGRFFAWVIGGSLPAALGADWLTSAWDQNAGMFTVAPAASIVEEIAGEWLKEILQLPRGGSYSFVTGCQMAHATCLAAARHAVLQRSGHDVEKDGLYGSQPVRVLASTQKHGTIERALRLLGMGSGHFVSLESDRFGRVQPESLRRSVADLNGAPAILIVQAGELNSGSFDDFESLIPIAHSANVWVHVDGAFGLWAAASPKYRHLLKGIESADSWATDGHKWLNVPYDAGYAFVAHPDPHQASFSHKAEYLHFADTARDPVDWNPEHSRRARGFATYAAIRELGSQGIADLVERCCQHAHALVTGMGALPNAEVLAEPIINQGLVRFRDPRPHATEEDHARRTDAVVAQVLESGEAFFGATNWHSMRAVRVSVSGWRTSTDDVHRTIEAVRAALKKTS